MDPTQADFIKKVKVKYIKCKQGGLHQGQIMNFICIDPTCKSKGLICPVCQTTSHVNHQAMHLKIFLSEIHKNLFNNESTENQIMSLSDQLRKIQSSKKQMLKTLKEMINVLVDKVREVQDKINNSYLTMRKIILSQSTISVKLPQLYNLLIGQTDDQQVIISQIEKFSQFLEYKNNKVHTIDSAKKLIEEYSKTASTVSIHLSTILPEIEKKLSALPLKIAKTSASKQKNSNQSQKFVFSSTKKAASLLVTNQTELSIDGDDMGGLAFIQSSNAGDSIQKVSIKIKDCVSGSIALGVGLSSDYEQKNFVMDQIQNPNLFGISSMGFPLNDFDNPSFVFGTGDIIDIEWNIDDAKLTFSRRNGIQKCQIFPPMINNMNSTKFFVSLVVPGDKVEIVNSN